MGSADKRSLLAQHIAAILGTGQPSGPGGDYSSLRQAATKSLICGGVAMLVMAPVRVDAIGLGNISLKSVLGQRLQATVPMRVAAGETVASNCVTTSSGGGGLSAPSGMRVNLPAVSGAGTYDLKISTANALHEPMYELSVVVNCPGVPVLVRQYVLMLDLPGALASVAEAPAEQASRTTVASNPTAPSVRTRSVASNRNRTASGRPDTGSQDRLLKTSDDSIQAGASYRVRSGDSLSTIARRVEGRLPDSTWQVANLIFENNPNAFIRNNPNLIKLGSLITVPGAEALADIWSTPTLAADAASTQTANAPEPIPAPAPKPAPAPIIVSEAVSATRTEAPAQQVSESIARSNPETGAETNASTEIPDVVAASAAPIQEVVPQADATVASSPFVDEQASQNPVADETIQATPEPVIAETEIAAAAAVEGPANEVSPLLAIAVGLFLGLIASLILLRGKLLDAVRALLRPITNRKAKSASTEDIDPDTISRAAPSGLTAAFEQDTPKSDEPFDQSVARAAFDTGAAASEDVEPIAIGNPMEDTYIVEASEHEPTTKIDEADIEPVAPDAEQSALSSLDETSNEAMLSELFDEAGLEDSSALSEIFDPTAEMSAESDNEIFDPTAEMPSQLSPEGLEPTAQMPAQADNDIFDPTAETMEAPGIDGEIESTLMQSFSENLEDLNPENLFDTAESPALSKDATGDSDLSGADADLTELNSFDDDQGLSETLHEALALLESDYEEEFTASQILERSEINKSLNELEDTQVTPPKRKKTG
jgi:hypothetical protein